MTKILTPHELESLIIKSSNMDFNCWLDRNTKLKLFKSLTLEANYNLFSTPDSYITNPIYKEATLNQISELTSSKYYSKLHNSDKNAIDKLSNRLRTDLNSVIITDDHRNEYKRLAENFNLELDGIIACCIMPLVCIVGTFSLMYTLAGTLK